MARPTLHAIGALAMLAASSASAAEFSSEAGVVSDYRFRGLSLSDGRPAVQASATIETESGLYLTVWGSTIDESGSDWATEIDLVAGYAIELPNSLSFDLSGTYYVYPSDHGSNYFEATAIATCDLGPASVSLGSSFVPKQGGTPDDEGRSRSNRYYFGEIAYELPGKPITVTARAGYERGYFDEVRDGGKWDWSLGADWDAGRATFGLDYVGTNADGDDDHSLVASAMLTL